MKKKLLLGILLALLALMAAGTALAADSVVRQLECETCGEKTLFDRLYYKAEDKLYINGKTGHIGWYQCRECGRMTSNLSDFVAHSGGTATCTERAICEVCGAPYGDYAHVFEPIESKAPTCTERGWKDGKTCVNCGYTTRTYIGKRYHAMSISTRQEPTCTEKGWKESHCLYEDCDYVYHTDIPALEHDLVLRDAKAPTCTEKGWEDYVCQREGCDYTTRVDIDKLDHDLEPHDAKAPTCTEIGWDAYESCKNCDYTTRVDKPALEHDLVVGTTKAPTCTEAGYKILVCQREGCDYTTRVDIDKLDHDIIKHDAKAPTCTEIGWNAYETCKNCDYTTRVDKPALNHDIIKHDAKAPTCTEIGWNAYETCKRCDYTTYSELAALGHDYESRTVKPTCTEEGYTRHTCTRCGDKYTDSRTEKLWHWFGEWTPNAESAESIHSALCLRGCGYTSETFCTPVEFLLTAEGEETPFSLTLCPVCGEYMDGAVLELIESVTAKPASEKDVLPIGAPVLRMGALENGNVVMSIAFEYDSHPVQPTGAITFTLPAELLEGYTLSLVNADGTVAPLTAEIDGEGASFTLDFTDAETPALLIHLIPAA